LKYLAKLSGSIKLLKPLNSFASLASFAVSLF
jgi:hypothetical protein